MPPPAHSLALSSSCRLVVVVAALSLSEGEDGRERGREGGRRGEGEGERKRVGRWEERERERGRETIMNHQQTLCQRVCISHD